MPAASGVFDDNQGTLTDLPVALDHKGRVKTGANPFVPSSYDVDLTMNGTAQGVALATGVKNGGGKIRIVNRGATTEAIRVAFGTSEANAEANLAISAAAATTGYWIGTAADGHKAEVILGVPADATHYAVANAVASDTQVVSVTQGV